MSESLWDEVVGQPGAVDLLRKAAGAPVHAYLFEGPRGAGKRAAARAFAAELLSDGADDDEAARIDRLVGREQHPDVIVVERSGASINADQAREIVSSASRSSVEGRGKVLVLDEFHLVTPAVAPILLKSIEEPPPKTWFVVLVDELVPDLATIASRCVRVPFSAVPTASIVAALERDGVARQTAEEVAAVAGGDLARARLLATDEALGHRVAAWRDVSDRLDGTGAMIATVVDDLVALVDAAAAPIDQRHAVELEEFAERVERYGERGSGRRQLEERQRRERRRARTDELRLGLGVLANHARDRLMSSDPGAALAALDAIGWAADGLERNANEALLLWGLFVRMRPV